MRYGQKLTVALLCALLLAPAARAQTVERPEPSVTSGVALETSLPVEISAPSCMLVEAETGTVIFEKNADERREVASVTKLMTLLLCFEELEAGRIALTDSITISPAAAAQKGSQALLDAGASYPLETLLKSTIIASANDSACALAEHMAGTEAAFVERMNARAQELGLVNTRYQNCTGLPQDDQYTTARDVAALSCAISAHEAYHAYASVWMDTLKHPSGRVTELTNTNRLVRFYEGCDGFKTGSTDAARYCLSATAQKNGMRLIVVVLGAQASQKRFDDARAMLDYGFASYKRTRIVSEGERLGKQVAVRMGAQESVDVAVGGGLTMLLRIGQEKLLSLEAELPDEVRAPVKAGDALGVIRIKLGDQVVAKLPAVAATDVRMPSLLEGFYRLFENWR